MNCIIKNCTGLYEDREIVHTLIKNGNVIVFDKVPAKVCPICGDIVLAATTVRRVEAMLRDLGTPERSAPVYEYRKSA